MPVRRWRECPGCHAVVAGGQLRPVRYGAHWSSHGLDKRRCPTDAVVRCQWCAGGETP